MHIILLLSILPLLAGATPITARAAGAPVPKPIPPTCTIINPLPHSNCTSTTPTNNLKPNLNFTSTRTLYASYFDLPTAADELWTHCIQQCYGYGDKGECKSAVLGFDVPVPEGYYVVAGRELRIACLLFDAEILRGDFEKAAEGQWRDVRVGGGLRCAT